MAVTITALQLAAALRIGDGSTALAEPQASVISRILATATAVVERYAPEAPSEVQNEAVVRLAGYLYDAPPGASTRTASAMRDSGAMDLLSTYRIIRARGIPDDDSMDSDDSTDSDRTLSGMQIAELLDDLFGSQDWRSGGRALSDDAVLDSFARSRTSADRGKFLGVSETDENAIALLDAPSSGPTSLGRSAITTSSTAYRLEALSPAITIPSTATLIMISFGASTGSVDRAKHSVILSKSEFDSLTPTTAGSLASSSSIHAMGLWYAGLLYDVTGPAGDPDIESVNAGEAVMLWMCRTSSGQILIADPTTKGISLEFEVWVF